MIGRLKGLLLDKKPDRVCLDVSGVGYIVHTSLQSFQGLPLPGHEVTLHTHLHVREDALLLYGFLTEDETEMFERCISVSGVGPKLALTLLSGFDVPQLVEVLQRSDIAQLSKLPGIGKKTAERLVLELRDKCGPRRPGTQQTSQGVPFGKGPSDDVEYALSSLGYRPLDAEKASQAAQKQYPDGTIQQRIRYALSFLQKG